jgi:hypothetical protein
MFVEFKVELDKIDSQAYPEIYAEQAFIFINDAIMELSLEGRKSFEKTTQVADDFRTLVAELELTPIKGGSGRFTVDIPVSYMYYIASVITAEYNKVLYTATSKESKHNEINRILTDPFNKPSHSEIPFLMVGTKLLYLTPTDCDLKKVYLTFMKLPAKVSKTINCDLPEQTHKVIVKRAVQIALENIESRRVQTNK